MRITMIGHSTVLIEMNGKKILADPYFGKWGHIAYKRLVPPAKTREDLRDVNLVLISHNHWDHIDRQYLSLLSKEVPVLVPHLTGWITKLMGVHSLTGIKTWEEKQFEELRITAVPAWHVTKTVGYVIQGEQKQVYFAGDTYNGSFMQKIGNRFNLDVALIPVTTYRIPMTMGEKSAFKATRQLNPTTVIPIHLGISPRSPLLRTGHTPQGYEKRVREAGLKTRVVILHEGESWP
jgi:L-ascorbate metabolism protein UlaG (beta-lactamase superfamily)